MFERGLNYLVVVLFLLLTLSKEGYAQPAEGSDCNNAYQVSSIPFNETGFTSCGFGNDYTGTDCENEKHLQGQDFVFEFTPKSNGPFNIGAFNSVPVDKELGLFILEGCPDSSGICVASAAEYVRGAQAAVKGLSLTAGSTYYIIVSSEDSTTDCSGFDFSLEESPAGANCDNADKINSVPFEKHHVVTCGLGSDYPGACPGSENLPGEDYIFEYTPSEDDTIKINVENENSDNGVKVGVSVFDGCPGDADANCMGSDAGDKSKDPAVLDEVPLKKGHKYFIVVSGDDPWKQPHFKIQVKSDNPDNNPPGGGTPPGGGGPPVGGVPPTIATCVTPYVVPTLPFRQDSLTTCGQNNDYGSGVACFDNQNYGGKDYIFAYTPSTDVCIQAKAQYFPTDHKDYKGGIAILDNCPEKGGNCVEYRHNVQDKGAPGDSFQVAINFVELKAGKTYYFVVASGAAPGRTSADCFPFEFTVREWSCPIEELHNNPFAGDCGSNVDFERGDLTGWNGQWFDPPFTNLLTDGSCCADQAIDNPPYQNGEFMTNNVGFSDGVNSVNGDLGSCGSNIAANGINPPEIGTRHTLTTGNGTDPNTDGDVPVVAPNGGKYSIRIGNQEPGWGSECLWSTFTVSEENAYFNYMYAVVLQDPPGHIYNNKPRFEITITENTNNQVIDCGGSYNVVSMNAVDSFNLARKSCGSSVWYQNWQEKQVDLTDYIGQDITVRFCTADCGMGGHFGYAYVDAYCESMEPMKSSLCVASTNDPVTLTSPVMEGAEGHTWFRGDTSGPVLGSGTSYTVNSPQDGDEYTVSFVKRNDCGGFITRIATYRIRVFNVQTSGDTTYCKGMAPDSVFLKVNDQGNGITYSWNSIPKGYTSNEQNPVFEAPLRTTTFTLELYENDAPACAATDPVVVNVTPGVTPKFSLIADCESYSVQFQNETQGEVNEWYWNFGDGTTSDERNPVHDYSGVGPYTITLALVDDLGCADTARRQLTLTPPPVAGFLVNDSCANENVSFSDNSFGNVKKWYWDFGDGNVSSEPNPVHVYNTGGNYTISLIVTNELGCTDTTERNIVQHDINADFDHVFACSGLIVTFSLTDSSDSNIVSWYWEFGDGNSSTESEPTHVFEKEKTYTITLTLVNDKGCTKTISKKLLVEEPCEFEVWFPNAFTPDSEGSGPSPNNRARVRGTGIEQLEIRIFDRWGELVYHTKDISEAMENGWDGTVGDELLEVDSYAWYITALPDCCDKDMFPKIFRKGSLTLLR